MIFLNDAQARRFSLNPAFKIISPALIVAGKIMFAKEERWEHPECVICDVEDVNLDSMKYFNGNMLIEYPKKSKQFWCSCCFQNSHSDKVVNRILGTVEERGWD